MKKFIQLVLNYRDDAKIVSLLDDFIDITDMAHEDTQSAFSVFMPRLNALYQKYTKLFEAGLKNDIYSCPDLFDNLQTTTMLAAFALQYQGNYEASLQVLDYFDKLIRDPRIKIGSIVFERIELTKAENQMKQWIVSFDSQEQLFTQDQIFDFRDVFFQHLKKDKLALENLALYYFTEGALDKAQIYLAEHFDNKTQKEKEKLAHSLWESNKMLAFQCSIGCDYQNFLKEFFQEKNITPNSHVRGEQQTPTVSAPTVPNKLKRS